MDILPALKETIKSLKNAAISADRKEVLDYLIDCIKSEREIENSIKLYFICTHNSRRSHYSQVWAQCLASYFDIQNVTCYSGGTETTAIYPMVLETLESSGFEVTPLSAESNPIYSIKYAVNEHPIIGFSKEMEHSFNPKTNFLAVFTCNEAEQNCPIAFGAKKKISLPFIDPKAYDNNPIKFQKYNETNLQIATEFYYVFSQIRNQS